MSEIRRFRWVVMVWCFVLVSCAEQSSVKPNFLVIVVDDLGKHDLGVTGSQFYETPNIDHLASVSTQFENGYATCAVCSPSRASLLTGKFTATHGITDWIGSPSGTDWRKKNRHTVLLPAEYEHRLDQNYVTLPEALKDNGYKTLFAGKWHVGSHKDQSSPTDHGFDINIGGTHKGSPHGGFFAPFNNPELEERPDEKGMSLSMRLANETSKFIEDHKDNSFLAYLSFYAVHAPIQTTEEKWNKYRDKAEEMGLAENGFEMERVLPIRVQQDNPVYAGLIEHVDDAIGSVLSTLERLGLDENTVVIFTSDNGGVASGDNFSTSNLPLRGGKGYQWEGGLKVPLFIHVPWMENRAMDMSPATGADLYPTILDLANIPLRPDQHTDGQSLLAALKGEEMQVRPLYWHYPHYGNQGGEPHAIIRLGDWKLIHYWEDDRDELYHLSSDPGEQKDLANSEFERVSQMRAQLLSWLQSNQANYPTVDQERDPVKTAEVLQNHIKRKDRLEQERKKMLSPDWKPNDNWWGSKVGEFEELANSKND
ncbi:sulfatase [Reichenbachiella ulvae]|uniref:Sulfatase n=1 Tax=Reichenbachiella ulvae TaxID=2980104 RepID=A0ABT3CSJ4_9BACT|nr:sulfatase [Reichenbachiella ulvae]MCV9386676.1 sulfatase [Reichenbachiella ulvae]